jgi:endonuclease YncB( thermonuclease family)
MTTVLLGLLALGAFVAVLVAIGAVLVAAYQKLRRRPTGQAARVAAASGVAFLALTVVVAIIATPAKEVASNDPKPQPKQEEKAEPKAEAKKVEKKAEPQEQKPKPEKSRESRDQEVAQVSSTRDTSTGTPGGTTVTVVDVVDGDTIDISPAYQGMDRVRLLSVDTPEVYGGEEPCGQEAGSYTTTRLEGQQVKLTFDEDLVDPYDRLLAFVWLDGVMFNKELVEQGYAETAFYSPNYKHQAELVAAEATAPDLACNTQSEASASATATASASASASASAPAEESGGDIASRMQNGQDDLNCEDLPTPMPTAPGDEDGLDADEDGTACE